MYRTPEEYDRMDQLAISLYVDYDLNEFPIDEKVLCRKMGINLVPYSAHGIENRKILSKRSKEGFLNYGVTDIRPTIFYNDCDNSVYGNCRQTIFHELKHFLEEDKDEEEDDLAEHFGRYLACPTAYLIWKKITNVNEIISTFDVSASIAKNVSSSVENRINRYGYRIFDYEKPLINLFK